MVILLALVCVQITLGALTVLSGKQYIINSLHVVTGGLVLVTSLVLTLRAHRGRFPLGESLEGARESPAIMESRSHGGSRAGVRA